MHRWCSLLLAAGLVVSACSLNPDDESSRPTDPDVIDGSVPEELAFEDEDRAPGVLTELRLALTRPVSYGPDRIDLTDQSAVIVADLLYDGLTEAGADGELRPALARSWAPEGDDFSVWRFTLDPDRNISPGQVVASIDSVRFADRSGSVGVVADRIGSVEADGEDVVFTLDRPDAGFPWLMAGLPFSVAGDDGSATGLYELTSDDANGVVLRSERDLPSVTVTWTDTPHDAYDLLTLGTVDAAVADPESIDDAGTRFGADFPATTVSRFLVANRNSAVLSTPEARSAVAAAIDRESLAEAGFESSVMEIDGVVSPSVAGFRIDGCGQVCELDPAGAAGVVDGLDQRRLVVGHAGDGQGRVAGLVASDLRTAGFEVESVEYDSAGLATAIVAGQVDLFTFGWIGPGPSVDAVVPMLFGVDSPVNVARIGSSAVDELLIEAASTPDDERRWDLYGEAHATALQSGLVIPLSVSTSSLAATPQLVGLPLRVDGSIDMTAFVEAAGG